jgi:predicted small lipoprotein YifL
VLRFRLVAVFPQDFIDAMRFALILFVLALTLQGCGNKGPLFLPDNQPGKQPSQQEKK